jgi:hypothetical protein
MRTELSITRDHAHFTTNFILSPIVLNLIRDWEDRINNAMTEANYYVIVRWDKTIISKSGLHIVIKKLKLNGFVVTIYNDKYTSYKMYKISWE